MKQKTKARIEELERRIRELEARPLPVLPPIHVGPWPAYQPHGPGWYPYPAFPIITCKALSNTACAGTTAIQVHNLSTWGGQ